MISILVKLNPNYRRVSFTSELDKNYDKGFIVRISNPQSEHTYYALKSFKYLSPSPTWTEKACETHIIYKPSSILSKTQNKNLKIST